MTITTIDGEFQPIEQRTTTINGETFTDIHCYKLDEDGDIDDVVDGIAAVYILRYARTDTEPTVIWGEEFKEVW